MSATQASEGAPTRQTRPPENHGAKAADILKPTADNVQTLVVPDTGHWLAEQAPDQMVTALNTFLTGYRT